MTETPSPDSCAGAVTRSTMLYRAAQMICQLGMRICYDYKAYGRENIPRRGGVLLASNHESYLDPVLVGLLIQRPVAYFARSTLFENALFGPLINGLGAFPVRQGEGDIAAVREAIRRLNEGRMLVLFPEGGRSTDGELAEFQRGFALIVRRAGVPVVPVAVEGAYEAWPIANKLPGPGRLRVMYGKPLDAAGMKPDGMVKLLRERIAYMAAELERRSRAER